MKSSQHHRATILSVVLTGAALTVGGMPHSVARAQVPDDGFQLRPGVVVHPNRGLVYVMVEGGGIRAVDLARGTEVWNTEQASKPLALAGDLLISQAEASGQSSTLRIVALDTRPGGEQVVSGTRELPAGVRVSIDEMLGSSFTASVRVDGADVFLSWNYSTYPATGIPPADTVAVTAQVPSSGTLRMDLSSGAITPVDPEEVPPARVMFRDLSAEERLPGVSGTQFLSADGRHVVASERVADDRVWDKYRWTVYERATNKPLGEIRTHVSRAPFVVYETLLIYETQPYVRAGSIEQPLKLRAIDLDSGQEVWGAQIRDTRYRGPYPP